MNIDYNCSLYIINCQLVIVNWSLSIANCIADNCIACNYDEIIPSTVWHI